MVRPAGEDNAGDLEKRASLFERDSVHGWFDGSVVVDKANSGIIANGRFIKVIYAADPKRNRLHVLWYRQCLNHRQHR